MRTLVFLVSMKAENHAVLRQKYRGHAVTTQKHRGHETPPLKKQKQTNKPHRDHVVPRQEMRIYKKSLRESCAKGSCPGARRGL